MYMQEETLLTSNNNSITLTNKRVIQSTSTFKKKIPLKEIVSTEIVRNFDIFPILSVAIGVILFFYFRFQNEPSRNERIKINDVSGTLVGTKHYDGSNEKANAAAIFTGIALIGMFIKRPKKLRIKGSFNSIEFSVKQMSKTSLDNFIQKLQTESDKRKAETWL